MWKSFISYALSSTNYGVTNMNNLYNFIISLMDILNEEQKQEMVDSIILHLGQSFYKGFRVYCLNKIPNSPHIQILRI